ncbi:unnamed protein product [Effrenium voratum]|uniref:Uncharacterized protein n=1 Tax=Effrenium voratum TaxID=2562239 RepID=A0AA36NI67_9DINO|nr:unnamed protein product [Effrenium voratum]CAJ1403208.1 unnamed protein product [Effrenium voratum]
MKVLANFPATTQHSACFKQMVHTWDVFLCVGCRLSCELAFECVSSKIRRSSRSFAGTSWLRVGGVKNHCHLRVQLRGVRACSQRVGMKVRLQMLTLFLQGCQPISPHSALPSSTYLKQCDHSAREVHH